MDANVIIIPRYLYDEWAKDELCLDFEKETLCSLEERIIMARQEMNELYPKEDNNDIDDINDYIGDNLECFPQLISEFEEDCDARFLNYTSKTGDEIVIIIYE